MTASYTPTPEFIREHDESQIALLIAEGWGRDQAIAILNRRLTNAVVYDAD
jgi:hypothetical protein